MNLFDSLSCAACGNEFPPNVIPNECETCGSTAYASATSTIATSVSIRHRYAYDHISAAALHTRNSGAIEKEYGGDTRGLRYFADNRAFVTAAIFSTVAFLEATINEFYSDIAEGHIEDLQNLDGLLEIQEQIKSLWTIGIPRTASFRILDKFQIALTLTKKTLFDKGAAPYQEVSSLIKLRNHLIHAEPENQSLFSVGNIARPKPVKPILAEALKDKFPICRLMEKTGNPFFPDKCLGHGCAEWGVISSLKFTDEFFLRLGLTRPYDGTSESLKTRWSESE